MQTEAIPVRQDKANRKQARTSSFRSSFHLRPGWSPSTPDNNSNWLPSVHFPGTRN